MGHVTLRVKGYSDYVLCIKQCVLASFLPMECLIPMESKDPHLSKYIYFSTDVPDCFIRTLPNVGKKRLNFLALYSQSHVAYHI